MSPSHGESKDSAHEPSISNKSCSRHCQWTHPIQPFCFTDTTNRRVHHRMGWSGWTHWYSSPVLPSTAVLFYQHHNHDDSTSSLVRRAQDKGLLRNYWVALSRHSKTSRNCTMSGVAFESQIISLAWKTIKLGMKKIAKKIHVMPRVYHGGHLQHKSTNSNELIHLYPSAHHSSCKI